MEYYVYVYFDPRITPEEPIYVGRGKGDRFKHHLTKKTQNNLLAKKLKKIKEAGLEPIIRFAKENLSFEQANELERELIAKLGRLDLELGPLCNFTDGGDGTYGYKHKQDTLELFSEQRKGKKQTEAQYLANCSRKHSEEAKAKISKVTKGHRRHTPEQIQILKAHGSNREITQDMRDKWSATRLGNTPTKATYPPLNELIQLVENLGWNKTAKQLGIDYSSLAKYLKRRGYVSVRRHNHQSSRPN